MFLGSIYQRPFNSSIVPVQFDVPYAAMVLVRALQTYGVDQRPRSSYKQLPCKETRSTFATQPAHQVHSRVFDSCHVIVSVIHF